ncbi:MAG: hypothetical protein ACI9IA_001429, partial [Enterobacterales bacterium]
YRLTQNQNIVDDLEVNKATKSPFLFTFFI